MMRFLESPYRSDASDPPTPPPGIPIRLPDDPDEPAPIEEPPPPIPIPPDPPPEPIRLRF